jgi:hypothetical protein
MPESIEHSRLCRLQDPFYARMDALIKQMFATPAQTAEGRRAKATVLLGCVMGDEWRRVDAETDYPELMVKRIHYYPPGVVDFATAIATQLLGTRG